MRKHLGSWKSVVVVFGIAAFAAMAMAQETDSGSYYADEAAMCYATDGADEILSVGGAYTEDMKVACWAEYNSCKQRPAINLGDVWGGRIGGNRYQYPDVYYDESGECGWATNVGTIGRYDQLYVYVGNAMVLGASSSTDTGLKVLLDVWDYQNSTTCGANPQNHWSDGWQCCGVDASAGDQNGYRDMSDYGIGDCGSSDTDGGNCHMPDLVLPGWGQTTPTAYRFRISTYVCDDTACTSNCSAMGYQEGCFYVNHS